MKKLILSFSFLFFLLSSFLVSAQYEAMEEFKPLPNNIKKLTAIQHSIFEGDTTSENFFEYNFNKNGDAISYKYFTYHLQEDLKYDSLNRIVEIDALYGESFANGNIKYEYPSKNQKIEIHDKMGFYQYKKSEFVFDSMDRISNELLYDSTFNKIEEYNLVYLIKKNYQYDKNGNIEKESHVADSDGKLVYTYQMDREYNKEKLIKQTVHYFKDTMSTTIPTIDYYSDEIKQIYYVQNGDFEGKIEKEIELIAGKNDTINYEVYYKYQKLDSTTISQEKNYFNNKKRIEHNKYFYKNNHLIKLEEYSISKDTNQEPKLSTWTEYSYYFYENNKR